MDPQKFWAKKISRYMVFASVCTCMPLSLYMYYVQISFDLILITKFGVIVTCTCRKFGLQKQLFVYCQNQLWNKFYSFLSCTCKQYKHIQVVYTKTETRAF